MTLDSTIKELKDGQVTERHDVNARCYCFKELSQDRVVAYLSSNRVGIFEEGESMHMSTKRFENQYSVFLEGNKAYFPSEDLELVELDLDTFEEKVLMQEVGSVSLVGGQTGFFGVSYDGLCQTMMAKRDLTEFFPSIKGAYWTAVETAGKFGVVAVTSELNILDGSQLEKECNYFLLVDLISLEVVNRLKPLSVEWIEDGTPAT